MSLIARFRAMLQSRRLDEDLDRELRSHVEMRSEDSVAAGMSPDEARHDAQRRFGNTGLYKEDTRAVDIFSWLDTAARDVIYARRTLRRNPGFAAVAILTLGLGIGANTAIFSVVNAVLLKPLPYPDTERLVSITQTDMKTQAKGIFVSFTKFNQIREESRVLESLAAYFTLNLSFNTLGEPESIPGARASLDFFRILGVIPARGRSFLAQEEQPGGADVAIVSDGFWHSHFGGDESLLGRTITLDGKNVTVIGILPKTFQFPIQFPEPDIWQPRIFETNALLPEQVRSGAGFLSVIGKLRPGQSLGSQQAELKSIDAHYRAQFGSFADANRFALASVFLEESLVGGIRPSLLVLLAAVAFVLLIACANVANLLLARATVREREIAIRNALGATRGRLARQFLTESLCLSFGGGVLGVLMTFLLLPALRTLNPTALPRLSQAAVDTPVLLFSIFLCFVTGMVFGIVPSLQASRKVIQSALQEGSRGSSQGGQRGKFRATLVVAELAIALVLMTGAGLLIESFARLVHVDPGLTAHGLMTFPLSLPPNRYAKPEQQAEFYQQLLDKVRTVPGVEAAGVTTYLPLGGGARFIFVCPEGHDCQGIGKDPVIALRQVSTGYFEAARTPLRRGRIFAETDNAKGVPVVIVNETAAKRYWPNQDPIGKRIANSRDKIQREVVGVVADVKFFNLNAASQEEMYMPLAQNPYVNAALIVRSESNSQPLVAAVRAKISELDPTLPISGILSMEDVVANSVAQPRIIMQFVGVFAGFALLLAAIGIYGIMAYSVSQRKQEIGIRVAMGAHSSEVLRLVVGQGMRLTLLGVSAGVTASLLLTKLISSLLFGVHAIDPIAFTSAALILVGVALIACYVPARRAMRLDPIVVLRSE
jgi:putative ABC transport system permease protein